MSPALSVVIPSHSRVDCLAECLASLVRNSAISRWGDRPSPPTPLPQSGERGASGLEIIVVDDGSKRDIVSIVASQFSNIQIIRHDTPQGFCAAVNAGILHSRAPIVQLLNDDAIVTAGWYTAMTHFNDPSVVAVAPLVLMQNRHPERIDSAGDCYDRGGFARKRFHGRRRDRVQLARCEVDAVCAAAGFYRRAALIECGLFPKDFQAYFDDVDVSLRLRKLGRIVFEPASVVRHRVSASYGATPKRHLLEQQSCNEERLFWRNSERRDWPRHAAVLAAKALRRIEEGTLVPWVSGRLQALRSLMSAAQ